MNARLAARLTGWKIDIQSDTEFAQAEAEAAFGGGEEGAEDVSGRCAAILSNGKRCPNAALPGSRFCGVPAHQALEGTGSDRVGGEPEPVVAEAAAEDAEPTEGNEVQAQAEADASRPEELAEPEVTPDSAAPVTAPEPTDSEEPVAAAVPAEEESSA
jgi:transcription termination/antitermination protein NusA